MLTDTDREEISRGVVAGLEGHVIAAQIGRCPSVVSREIRRHGGRDTYRAVHAASRAPQNAAGPKTASWNGCPHYGARSWPCSGTTSAPTRSPDVCATSTACQTLRK
ncbi:helix-turn-helix domain-containing protein [Streptomyces sp. H27-D2]|uniref:helix-turn-helix domain-containing protein n=1 Tax=Streptomyces sp. H27-D2 TaxID=3046304 RepID=UPI003FA73BED